MSAVASQEEAQRFVEKPAPAEANSTGQDYCFEKAVDQLVLANLLRVNEFRSGPADDDAPDARGNRFPADFMFQLSKREFDSLKSQIVTSSWGGARRARPCAFTEQGVAMLSSVLRSEGAVQVKIEIMRAFVRLRRMLDSNAKLSRRLDELEAKYDEQFRVVFDAIRELMEPTDDQADRPRIGYESEARRTKPRYATKVLEPVESAAPVRPHAPGRAGVVVASCRKALPALHRRMRSVPLPVSRRACPALPEAPRRRDG